MDATVILCLLFSIIALSSGKRLHPLSEEFIQSINENQSLWVAGRNFPENTPFTYFRSLTGVLPRTEEQAAILPQKVHTPHSRLLTKIPDSFDARTAWPECASLIGEIRDQSECGSCWAFGAAEAISDRICIHSKGAQKVKISAQDLLTCCHRCGEGCNGGYPDAAWEYWREVGIVSGGAYGSNEGCKTYTFHPCEHHVVGSKPPCGKIHPTPKCSTSCDKNSKLSYSKNLYKGASAYRVGEKEQEIQLEILTNGPVEASFTVYEDFVSYKSGVYKHVKGDAVGGHAVKILGWGVERGQKYWLVANSWNEDWGDKGYFKIMRGIDECGIEEAIVAGIPRVN